ncbi:MAG: VanZ family protein [Saprospiraceae bacterium]|nr:VanZ family protein [Saprospiraceae bacterium]
MHNQSFEKKRTLYLIAAIICTIAVLVLSLLPPQSLSTFEDLQLRHLDKIVHAFMYAILAFLWFKTLNKGNFNRLQSAVIVIVISLYGALMEYAQILVIGRSFEWEDMVSNTIGAILGIVIASKKRTSVK